MVPTGQWVQFLQLGPCFDCAGRLMQVLYCAEVPGEGTRRRLGPVLCSRTDCPAHPATPAGPVPVV